MNDKANSWIPKPLLGDYRDANGNILTIGTKSIVSTASDHCKKKSFFSIKEEDHGRIYQLRFYEGEHERGKDSDKELSSVVNVLSETEISISGDCWHGKYTKEPKKSQHYKPDPKPAPAPPAKTSPKKTR